MTDLDLFGKPISDAKAARKTTAPAGYARRASSAPKGEKRKRRRVAVGARCLALALGVRQMRIRMKGDAHE